MFIIIFFSLFLPLYYVTTVNTVTILFPSLRVIPANNVIYMSSLFLNLLSLPFLLLLMKLFSLLSLLSLLLLLCLVLIKQAKYAINWSQMCSSRTPQYLVDYISNELIQQWDTSRAHTTTENVRVLHAFPASTIAFLYCGDLDFSIGHIQVTNPVQACTGSTSQPAWVRWSQPWDLEQKQLGTDTGMWPCLPPPNIPSSLETETFIKGMEGVCHIFVFPFQAELP